MSARERMLSLKLKVGYALPQPVSEALDRHCENLSEALKILEMTNPSQEALIQQTDRIIAIYVTELRNAIYQSTGQVIEDKDIKV